MVKYDPRCRYAESHEWVRVDGDDALVGISDFAQAELNDIVYVELPEVGDAIEKGEEFGTVESVKAASEVYMPVSGEVVAVNDALEDSPDLVNKDPFGNGWLVRVHMMAPSELEDLLDADAYRAVCEKDD